MKNIILICTLFLAFENLRASDCTYAPCIIIDTKNEGTYRYHRRPAQVVTNQEHKVIQFAKSFIGVPYEWGGTSIYGMDCSYYVRLVYTQLGLYLPRTSRQQVQSQGLNTVDVNQLRPLDLIFFQNLSTKKITHVAIYIGNGQIIHSSRDEGGVQISNFDQSSKWQKIFKVAKRPKFI